jgi:hypothetical protein
VTNHPLPNKFKVPQIPNYSGVRDPTKHYENYRMHLALHAMLDEIACRAFPTTLSGNAKEWFQGLMPNSISTFEDLTRIFLTQFLGSCERKKAFWVSPNTPSVRGRKPERVYGLIQFGKTKGVIFSAIYQGISLEESEMRKLAWR